MKWFYWAQFYVIIIITTLSMPYILRKYCCGASNSIESFQTWSFSVKLLSAISWTYMKVNWMHIQRFLTFLSKQNSIYRTINFHPSTSELLGNSIYGILIEKSKSSHSMNGYIMILILSDIDSRNFTKLALAQSIWLWHNLEKTNSSAVEGREVWYQTNILAGKWFSICLQWLSMENVAITSMAGFILESD